MHHGTSHRIFHLLLYILCSFSKNFLQNKSLQTTNCSSLLAKRGWIRVRCNFPGEAELHDVGELPVGVRDGLVVADDEALERVGQRLELDEAARRPLRLRGEHLDALGLGRPVGHEYGVDVGRLQAGRRVEEVQDLGECSLVTSVVDGRRGYLKC